MAVTAGKGKVRLDFAEMIEEAVPSIKEETIEQLDMQEPEVPVKKDIVVEKKEPAKPKKSANPKDNTGIKDIEAVLTSSQNGRGVQKSVYLEDDIHNYIQSMCKKTNAKYSKVLNLLLRNAIEQLKK